MVKEINLAFPDVSAPLKRSQISPMPRRRATDRFKAKYITMLGLLSCGTPIDSLFQRNPQQRVNWSVLCEALVGGRATAALIAAIRDEPEEHLIKRLWGDNCSCHLTCHR